MLLYHLCESVVVNWRFSLECQHPQITCEREKITQTSSSLITSTLERDSETNIVLVTALMVLNSLIQAAHPFPACPQAGHLSSGQPAADCGLQEPGGRGGEAAQGAIRL